MIPDAEISCVIAEVFEALDMQTTIKHNHRKILDGIFSVAGVPADKTRSTSSVVDKLDKAPWAEVKKEMVEEKGLSEEIADRIGTYVQRSGSTGDMLEALKSDAELCAHEDIKAGIANLDLLASYAEAMGITDKISFDLSLARGSDSYSGLIYEVIPKTSTNQPSQVGTLRQEVATTTLSAFDRIFTILDGRRKKTGHDLSPERDVYIMASGGKDFNGLLLERMAVARQLWKAGIRADFAAKVKPKLLRQFAASEGVPVAVILGDDEVAAGQVRLKVMGGDKEAAQKDRGRLVPKDDVVDEVRKWLAATTLT